MKKLLTATTGALALVMLLAGSVFAAEPATASASTATGEPAIDAQGGYGYYLWFDGDRIHLRTTDDGSAPGPSEYTGVVTANSAVRDVNLIRAEDDDWAVASGNQLDFRFRTYNAVDGVSFTAHDATRLTFRLYRNGHLIETRHMFLGAGKINPPGNPFTLFVNR